MSVRRDDPETGPKVELNPGFPAFQLARSLRAASFHEDAALKEKAEARAEKWIAVMQGWIAGELTPGSRTPLRDVPAWATLEVLRGGFASGSLLAEGPLQAHEVQLLHRLGFDSVDTYRARARLNSWFLTDEGLSEVSALLSSGRYRIQVPEEAALLVVAWLVEHGGVESARTILEEIAPFFGRLRFYPVPHDSPLRATATVRVQNVADTIQELKGVRPRPEFERQRESARVWTPLYDALVALFAETVREGWPCSFYPEGWTVRARELLSRIEEADRSSRLCRWPRDPRLNFAPLRAAAETCVTDPRALSGRDVGKVRSILRAFEKRRGLPGSERLRSLRHMQSVLAARPSRVELAGVLRTRLERLPQDEGLDAADEVLAPVTVDEQQAHGVLEGCRFPDVLERKVARSLDAPLEVLVERGVVRSSEMIARVIPLLSAQARAAGIVDDELQRLFGATYVAFRRRRSLLLLNLQSQVRLEELPWIAALNAYRSSALAEPDAARRLLVQVASLTLTSFPHVILPNKLLQELRTLLVSAALDLPVVDELAADIFMGAFSEKFVDAARRAETVLAGSLYARYYELGDVDATRSPAAFAAACARRADRLGRSGGWSVASNGMVIEQAQILTTHNLATLFQVPGVRTALEPHLLELAQRCFSWMLRTLSRNGSAHERYRAVRLGAYAWRQMIFFLSFLPSERQMDFVPWAEQELSKSSAGLSSRFASVLHELDSSIRGASSKPSAGGWWRRSSTDGWRPFTGWSSSPHWLVEGL